MCLLDEELSIRGSGGSSGCGRVPSSLRAGLSPECSLHATLSSLSLREPPSRLPLSRCSFVSSIQVAHGVLVRSPFSAAIAVGAFWGCSAHGMTPGFSAIQFLGSSYSVSLVMVEPLITRWRIPSGSISFWRLSGLLFPREDPASCRLLRASYSVLPWHRCGS